MCMPKIEMEAIKVSKTVVFELRTLPYIYKIMNNQQKNFSQAVNYLIISADYLLKKIELLRQEDKINENKAAANVRTGKNL